MWETQFDSWVGKIPWKRDRLPTSVFLGFPCGSANKESACNVGDLGLIPRSGRSPGEGIGCPLQYSDLENPGSQRVGHDWVTVTFTFSFNLVWTTYLYMPLIRGWFVVFQEQHQYTWFLNSVWLASLALTWGGARCTGFCYEFGQEFWACVDVPWVYLC